MTDLAPTIDASEKPSTVLDTEAQAAPSGGGAPRTLPDADKATSLRDTIATVVKEDDAERAKADKPDAEKPKEDAKPEAKAEKPEADDKPKAERGTDGKFVAKPKESEADQPKDEAKPVADDAGEKSDAKHYPEPPKSFQADSRELYRNVPRPVRRDINIMAREHEAFREQATKANARYETLRPYDELARSNGRDLRESLQKINDVENALRRDPIAGLNAVLREIGPRKADGSALNIYEIASHIIEQGPQQYQQRMQQFQASQPPASDPRVAETERELAEAREQLVHMQVIEPFKADHPRYDELQDAIARILQSGMIASSLSAPERLEAAYVMAERLVPPSAQPAETEAPAPTPPGRADDSFSGSKSIKSAPGAVSDDDEPERGGSVRELLEDELRRLKRSA